MQRSIKTKETKNGTRRGVVAEVKKNGIKLKPVSSMLFAKQHCHLEYLGYTLLILLLFIDFYRLLSISLIDNNR